VQQIALTKWDRATLLQRVRGFDALTCSVCGGRMRFIVVIKDRAASERILRHMGEDAEEEIARVATAWDAEALATAQAARVATAWDAWRDGRAAPHGPWPRTLQSATPRRTAMNAAVRVGGGDVVAGRGDLIRRGRGRQGGSLIGARRWTS
jgi:hypothetical protein